MVNFLRLPYVDILVPVHNQRMAPKMYPEQTSTGERAIGVKKRRLNKKEHTPHPSASSKRLEPVGSIKIAWQREAPQVASSSSNAEQMATCDGEQLVARNAEQLAASRSETSIAVPHPPAFAPPAHLWNKRQSLGEERDAKRECDVEASGSRPPAFALQPRQPAFAPPARLLHTTQSNLPPKLWDAVAAGNVAETMDLLEEGCDVEERHRGWTPLMKAAEEGHCHIAELLLDHGADIEATNRKGRSALSFAAAPSSGDWYRGRRGRVAHVSMVKLLVERGANMWKQDDAKLTPRKRAELERQTESVDILKELEQQCTNPSEGQVDEP